MGLKTTVDVNGGLRKLTDSRSDVRQWSWGINYVTAVDPYTQWYHYKETTNEKTYKWWGLTKGAADGAVATADQTGLEEDEEASYECSIDDRVVGSYTLTKTITSVDLEITTSQEPIEEEE